MRKKKKEKRSFHEGNHDTWYNRRKICMQREIFRIKFGIARKYFRYLRSHNSVINYLDR